MMTITATPKAAIGRPSSRAMTPAGGGGRWSAGCEGSVRGVSVIGMGICRRAAIMSKAARLSIRGCASLSSEAAAAAADRGVVVAFRPHLIEFLETIRLWNQALIAWV